MSVERERRSAWYRPKLERLRESSLQKLSQFRGHLKLRNRVQFLGRRLKGIRQTPDSSRPKLLILWLKVEIMHGASKVLGRFEFALHERLIDHHLRSDIREFTPLPCFDLHAHGFKVSLHSVYSDRNAIAERK